MSNIKELANVPEISFIENMSLQETEELVRANYTCIFKELTGQDAELGEADAKNLIIKSFSLVLYQVMQYVEALRGRRPGGLRASCASRFPASEASRRPFRRAHG